MICPTYPDPQYFIFSSQVPPLLYYSHLPAILISLLLGFFVYFKNRRLLLSKILLAISIVFASWTFLSLITWTNNDSQIIMFVWSFFGILYALLCIFSLYFVHVFINKKDISFRLKLFLGLLLFPVAIFAPTSYNINVFDLSTLCSAFDKVYYDNYYYGIGFLMFLWILFLLIYKYRKTKDNVIKKQIVWLGVGIEFFLFSFFITGYIASLLTENSYGLEFYGLFGMTFFMAMLAYLIVRFKAFNIKLLAAQALVVAIVILIGSQFFFIKSTTNMILTGITFVLSGVFGVWLIKSVKEESRRKEQLQIMADQLAEGNDKLQKLDNAKSEFLSIASHQLRTPPTAIKGYSSLLLEGSYGKLTPEQSVALNNVYKRNEDMITLIDNLLETSRIESGTIKFDFSKLKLEDLLKDIYETLIFKSKEKGVSLEFVKSEAPLPEITADKDKLKEVLSNLVDNAVKYTKKGFVSVKTELQKGFTALSTESSNPVPIVGAEKEDQEKEVIRIVVSDTGIGIPKTELPFLFQKFSRGKDISRLNVSGTGLGLFVGKEIMEALGGRVWAESDGEGRGSRFIVELPVEGKEKEEGNEL